MSRADATAKDVMRPTTRTVSPSMGLREVAEILWNTDHLGLCVVEGGELVGVITEADLTYRERATHVPALVALAQAIGGDAMEDEGFKDRLRDRFADVTAGDVMTGEPVTVGPDTPAAELAALMVRRALPFVPVLEDGTLIGAVTHRSFLRATYDL